MKTATLLFLLLATPAAAFDWIGFAAGQAAWLHNTRAAREEKAGQAARDVQNAQDAQAVLGTRDAREEQRARAARRTRNDVMAPGGYLNPYIIEPR